MKYWIYFLVGLTFSSHVTAISIEGSGLPLVMGQIYSFVAWPAIATDMVLTGYEEGKKQCKT